MVMLPVGIIDWQHLIIPNPLIAAGLGLGLVLQMALSHNHLSMCIEGAGVSFALVLAIRRMGEFLFKRECMGWGDVKLSAMLGLFLGWQHFLVSLWLASTLGLLYSALSCRFIFIDYWKLDIRHCPELPFGTFLAIASSFVLFTSELIDKMVLQWATSIQ